MSIWMTEDDFRAIALTDGVREVALNDLFANFQGHDGSVREFLKEIKPSRPHCWTATQVAGTPDEAALYSLEAQGAYLKANGEPATRALLAAEGLKLGQIRKAAKVDHATNNPYAPAKPGEDMRRLSACCTGAERFSLGGAYASDADCPRATDLESL